MLSADSAAVEPVLAAECRMNPVLRKYLIVSVSVLAALVLVPITTRQPREELLENESRVCYIDIPGNSLARGLTEAMVVQFGQYSGSVSEVRMVRDSVSALDSLIEEKADLVVMARPDSLPAGLCEARSISDEYAWIVRDDNSAELGRLNTYLSELTGSEHFQRLSKQYLKGKVSNLKDISPYDDLIREVAEESGWDWRLLAAVAYHESRFSMGANSKKGAVGLMQVRAGKYSIDTLLDPRVNLSIGARYLTRLGNMFQPYAADTTERLKFALAAYNAGEGKVLDYIHLAGRHEADSTRWNSVADVIRQHGKGRGRQTVAYVDAVLDSYAAYTRLYK